MTAANKSLQETESQALTLRPAAPHTPGTPATTEAAPQKLTPLSATVGDGRSHRGDHAAPVCGGWAQRVQGHVADGADGLLHRLRCLLLWDVLLPLPGLPGGRGHERVLPLRDQRGHEDPVSHPIQHPGQCGRRWWAPFSPPFSLNPHGRPWPRLGTLHHGSHLASGNSQAQRATAWPLCPCQEEP